MKLSTALSYGFVAGAATLIASPASAAIVGGPAPLIGAGIPAFAFLAGGYAAIRRRRGK